MSKDWIGYADAMMDEQMNSMEVICPSCGKHYSLHVATVCPECFDWPQPRVLLNEPKGTE